MDFKIKHVITKIKQKELYSPHSETGVLQQLPCDSGLKEVYRRLVLLFLLSQYYSGICTGINLPHAQRGENESILSVI